MGSSMSSMEIQSVDSPYMCIFFRQPDKIRIVHGPSLVGVVRQAIQSGGFNVREEFNYCGSHTIKLSGYPFSGTSGKSEAVLIRRMVCNLLAVMSGNGFTLVATSNVSRTDDISAWFFRREQVERPVQQVVCLSLSSYDSLMLINGENEPQMDLLVMEAIRSKYLPGLQDHSLEGSTPVYKLNDYPWNSDGTARRHGLWLLLEIVSQFQHYGYDYVGRVDFKGTADSLFFSRTLARTQIDALSIPTPQRCILSLERHDRIRLMGAPELVIDTVRAVIQQAYPKPIQRDSYKSDEQYVWDFKLSGDPWWATYADDAIVSRYLILKVFETLCTVGWRVNVTMETSRRLGDKSVFVIETCRPYPMHFICLSLNSTDVIRLINADAALVNQVRTTLGTYWPAGIQSESTRGPNDDVPEWKLNGYPWGSHAPDGVFSRALLCALLAMFEDNGWTLVTSADVSAKYHSSKNSHYPLDVDSWYLAKPVASGTKGQMPAPSAPGWAVDPSAPALPTYPEIGAPPSYDASMGGAYGGGDVGPPPSYKEAIGIK